MLRHRWTPVVLVALVLFVINAIGRAILWGTGMDAEHQMVLAGVYSMVAMAVVCGYAGFRWSRRYEMIRVVGEVGCALVLGTLLAVLVGPLLVGLNPVAGGLAIVLRQLGLCFAICVFGAVVGVLLVLALGQDRRSRAWRYQEHRLRTKPRRVAKR